MIYNRIKIEKYIILFYLLLSILQAQYGYPEIPKHLKEDISFYAKKKASEVNEYFEQIYFSARCNSLIFCSMMYDENDEANTQKKLLIYASVCKKMEDILYLYYADDVFVDRELIRRHFIYEYEKELEISKNLNNVLELDIPQPWGEYILVMSRKNESNYATNNSNSTTDKSGYLSLIITIILGIIFVLVAIAKSK